MLSERISEAVVGSCRLYLLQTTVESVVSFYGSFQTSPDLSRHEDLAQDILVSLLDKGTTLRDKFAIAADLDARGAELRYHSEATRVGFSGRCLRDDISPVLATCAEQLRTPALAESEFEKVLPRLQSSVLQSMESTSSQADAALRRLLFQEDHPNYALGPNKEMELLKDSNVQQARSFYESHFGATDFVMVVVGDIDEAEIIRAVESAFGDWQPRELSTDYAYAAPAHSVSAVSIPMADKSNIDVRIGHAIDVIRTDERYVPLYLGNYIFGGNFSARLMDQIRDKEGLTYGIYSSLRGFSSAYSGFFAVQATFSVENIARGIHRTNDLLNEFVDRGVTSDELESKKKTVAGSYKVGLASTGSLARTIAANIQNDLGVDYVDRFPEIVTSTSLDSVNDAIRELVDMDAMKMAQAGMESTEAVQLEDAGRSA